MFRRYFIFNLFNKKIEKYFILLFYRMASTTKKNKTMKKEKCAKGSHRVNGKCRTQKSKCKTGYHRTNPSKRCVKK